MAKMLILGLALAAAPVLPAVAAPATPEEAARLTSLLERYVPRPPAGEPSGVVVTPQGDSYALTLDLKRAFAELEAFGLSIEPNVSRSTLTPLPDGTWRMTSADSPPLTMHSGPQTITIKAATAMFDGIYDPKIYGFKNASSASTGYQFVQDAPNVTQDRKIDKVELTLKSLPADGGTTSVAGHYTATGTVASILVKTPAAAAPSPVEPGNPAVPPAPTPPTVISYTSPASTVDFSIDQMHVKELLDLWAFLVAHPDKASLTASQADFKSVLRAALPMFAGVGETGTFGDLGVKSPIGDFSAKSLAGGVALKGLPATGSASTTLSFQDLVVPADQLPAWWAGFIPTAMSLKIDVTGFRAAEAASEAITDFDLANKQPFTPEQIASVSKLLWPGTGTVTIAPSRLTSKLLDLKFDGQATIGSVPNGQITVTGTGLDNAIAALEGVSQSDPSAAQLLNPLVLAKNLAKPNPDGSLVWVIAATGSNAVTVNGTPLQ